MARLFTCGFEENNIVTAGGASWNAAAGTSVTVVGTAPHSGAAHLRTPSGVSGTTGPRKDFSGTRTSGTLFYRVYWRAATLPTSGTTTRIMSGASSGTAEVWRILHTRADNTIRLENVPATTNGSTTAVVTSGVWYRIELRMLVSTTVGELELKLYEGDATSPMTGGTILLNGGGSGEATISTNIQQFWCGPFSSVNQGQVWYFDDVAINDATGTFQTSWCGPGKIALQIGDEDVLAGFSDWTPNTGTDHFAMIDDLPGTIGTPQVCDDDTTYISASTAGLDDWVYLPGLPVEAPSNCTLILAHTNARMKGNAVTPQVRLRFWTGLDTYMGNTYTLTTAYAPANTANSLVVNLGALIKNDTMNFEHGVELIDSLEARCTAIWTNIEWLEATTTNTDITVPTMVYSGP
jgi:hypothetical protein